MKNNKIVLSFQDFCKYSKQEYQEDTYNMFFNDWYNYSINEIIDYLPAKYSDITRQKLEEDDELKGALVRALNRANDNALDNACYTAQKKAFETFADALPEYVDHVNDGLAPFSLSIDWPNENVTVTVEDEKKTCSVIVDIINGQGYFHYQSPEELAEVYDGKRDYMQAIESHLHYLLNVNLVSDIYGTRRLSAEVDSYAINSAYPDDNTITEAINDELAELEWTKNKRVNDYKFIYDAIDAPIKQIETTIGNYLQNEKIKSTISRNLSGIRSIIKKQF